MRPIARPVDIASLAKVVPNAARLWLPQTLQAPTGIWSTIVGVAFTGVMMGWFLLQLPGLSEPPLKWLVIGGSALGAVGVLWFQGRTPRQRRGWEVDFDNACLTPVGLPHQAPIYMDPAQHSLGCYLATGGNHTLAYMLELRHKARGPVAPLCRMLVSAGHTDSVAREMALLDRCVDTLAHRLRIRRSGSKVRMTAESLFLS